MAEVADITEGLTSLSLEDDLFPSFATIPTTLEYSEHKAVDHLIVQKLMVLDQIDELRGEVSELFRDGFIELARGQYAGGRTYRDCWDESVQATKRVLLNGTELVLEEVKQSNGVIKEKSGLEASDDVTGKEGLRNRKQIQDYNQKNPDRKKKHIDLCSDKRVEIETVKGYNPIQMFGALPSSQLRVAQKGFSTSIAKLIEISNLITKAGALNDQINTLQRRIDSKKMTSDDQ